MAKIKITKGVFGLKVGMFTQTKTKNDPPFEVDDAIAERLVKQGVAEIVTSEASTGTSVQNKKTTVRLGEEVKVVNKSEAQTGEATKAEATAEENTENGEEQENAGISYSMDDTKARLLEIAEELGIAEADPKMNKTQIIALLDAHVAGEEAEDSPSFGDVDGVVE